MRYVLQAVFALAVLIGLPVFLEAPATIEGMLGAGVALLIFAGAALHGVLGFVRSRKPKSFHDSMMPSKHVDVESTVIKPPKR